MEDWEVELEEQRREMRQRELNLFNEYRLNNQYCDVTIRVGRSVFPAHRHILEKRVEETKEALGIDMAAEDGTSEFFIWHLPPQQVEWALRHIYGQRQPSFVDKVMAVELDSKEISRGCMR